MTWLSLTIEVGNGAAEALSDALLELGALSVDIRDAHAGTGHEQAIFGEPGEPHEQVWQTAQISALFLPDADIPRIVAQAAQAAGLRPAPEYRISEVAEQDWVRLIQSQFEPIQISSRLWITPTWHSAPDPDAINLVLDPGLAFGTGSHPTTRLCLRWLDATIAGGEDVLDYGCGSGILAIAARLLGARRAVGIDIDPQAIDASRQNAAQNRVDAEFYTPQEAPAFRADIVLANILANPLEMLAPLLADRTRPGGRIALSGILKHQAEGVLEAYRQWFDMAVIMEEEGWVCLTGTKR